MGRCCGCRWVIEVSSSRVYLSIYHMDIYFASDDEPLYLLWGDIFYSFDTHSEKKTN